MSEEGLYQHLSANQIEVQDLPSALDVLIEERNKARIDDLTRRYPHGLDLYGVPELPQRKPLTRLIPAWLDILYGVD